MERPLKACVEAGFSEATAAHEHRHTSVLAIRAGRSTRRLVIDSEDSFIWMSPLIHDCDLYFCAGFSSAFFRERRFIEPYAWQTEKELAFYRERVDSLLSAHQHAFEKVHPFVFIAPSLGRRDRVSPWQQKIWNARHKVVSRLTDRRDWAPEKVNFEARYTDLLAMRDLAPRHDIVLMDSLWGWPRHRVALHRQLHSLAKSRDVHAKLSWAPPVSCDASDQGDLDPAEFPFSVGHIDNYERMLASSRLGVFATGFHWGWRNIMAFALMMGLPVLVDRLVVEPWFDIHAFNIVENEEFGMRGIEALLSEKHNDSFRSEKSLRQAVYDSKMAPEQVARQVLSIA